MLRSRGERRHAQDSEEILASVGGVGPFAGFSPVRELRGSDHNTVSPLSFAERLDDFGRCRDFAGSVRAFAGCGA
jgi:hypothetical protein